MLPDADRILSGLHCRIQWLDGRYLLTDTSQNGVFVNGSPDRVECGASVVLSDGDVLGLGDYELAVSIGQADEMKADALRAAGIPDPPDGCLPIHEGGYRSDGLGVMPDNVPLEREAIAPPRPSGPDRKASGPAVPSDLSSLPNDWFLGLTQGTAAEVDEIRPSPMQPVEETGASAELLAIFLEAAGLPAVDAADPPAAVMRRAGAIYRACIEGLHAVLAVRARMKNEMRIEGTVLSAADNNPLKFLNGTEREIAGQLLQAPLQGFLPGDEAVRQGLRDLIHHEMATSVGVQAALVALLKRFDPGPLKERLDRHSFLAGFVPAARRARYWELYEELFQEIAEEAEEDFHNLFGRAFAEAYSKQINSLTANRPTARSDDRAGGPMHGEEP